MSVGPDGEAVHSDLGARSPHFWRARKLVLLYHLAAGWDNSRRMPPYEVGLILRHAVEDLGLAGDEAGQLLTSLIRDGSAELNGKPPLLFREVVPVRPSPFPMQPACRACSCPGQRRGTAFALPPLSILRQLPVARRC
jgi:hypothetical protein